MVYTRRQEFQADRAARSDILSHGCLWVLCSTAWFHCHGFHLLRIRVSNDNNVQGYPTHEDIRGEDLQNRICESESEKWMKI